MTGRDPGTTTKRSRTVVAISACPGCGVNLPVLEGSAHPYMTCTPACWAAYGNLLAVQYQHPERMRFHQLVVDTYAVQHPDKAGEPRAVRSVGIHLMTLCLFLEHGADPALGTRLLQQLFARIVVARDGRIVQYDLRPEFAEWFPLGNEPLPAADGSEEAASY